MYISYTSLFYFVASSLDLRSFFFDFYIFPVFVRYLFPSYLVSYPDFFLIISLF
jgi:hypothetical protein